MGIAFLNLKQLSNKVVGEGLEMGKILQYAQPHGYHVQKGYISTAVYQIKDVNVMNLINEGCTCWDEEVLRDIFNERGVGRIRRISI